MQQLDRLFEIFNYCLVDQQDPHEEAFELVRRVTNIYALELMKIGHIPFAAFDTIMQDIQNDVQDMYRKKTYGYLTLKDYRSAQQSNKKSKDNK